MVIFKILQENDFNSCLSFKSHFSRFFHPKSESCRVKKKICTRVFLFFFVVNVVNIKSFQFIKLCNAFLVSTFKN